MSYYNQGFHFEVTPQKKCCLWPNRPGCEKYNTGSGNGSLCKYCCGHGFHGRPLPLVKNDGQLGFNYTPDGERWKKCGKFKGCNNGKKEMISRPGCYTPSGVR